MPRLVHIGLIVAAAAFAGDILAHLAPATHHHGGSLISEHAAHIAGLAAMTLVLLGIVTDGVRRHVSLRRRRAAPGGTHHAHR